MSQNGRSTWKPREPDTEMVWGAPHKPDVGDVYTNEDLKAWIRATLINNMANSNATVPQTTSAASCAIRLLAIELKIPLPTGEGFDE